MIELKPHGKSHLGLCLVLRHNTVVLARCISVAKASRAEREKPPTRPGLGVRSPDPMRTYVVPYRVVFGNPRPLPLCELELIGRTERVTIDVLVDSGAEYSVFPKKAADDAGLELPRFPNERVRFGASVEPAWKTQVYFDLEAWHLRADVFFVERLQFPYGLLGRRGVFARFCEVAFVESATTPRVEFRGDRGRIEL